MTSINFAGDKFELCPSGAMFWPAKDMLIMSDLHFEKSSYFAKKKIFLPPHDTSETLAKINQVCKKFKPKTLLFLGDIFHDKLALNRISHQNKSDLKTLINHYNVIWIEGNHDTGTAPDGTTILSNYSCSNIVFNHIATNINQFEISGHYHPCVQIIHKEQKTRRPCFIINDHKIIMPSFGVLTGGLNINDPIYKNFLSSPIQIFALGMNNVHEINSQKYKR